MWYASAGEAGTRLFLQNHVFTLAGHAFCVEGALVASIENGVFMLQNRFGRVLTRRKFVTKHPSRMIPGYFVTDEDTGCLYQLDKSGSLLQSLKIGEHISDMVTFNGFILSTVYHENRLVVTKNMAVTKEIPLPAMPLRLRANEHGVFVLMQTGFATILVKFNEEFGEETRIAFPPQPCEIFLKDDRLYCCGSEQRAVLTTDMRIRFLQKSTGETLCRDASDAVFLRDRAYKADPVSGVLYPV